MKKIFAILAFLVGAPALAQSLTLQQQIDAAEAAGGGMIILPCGSFGNNGAPIAQPSSVIIQGSGPCTKIAAVTTKYPGVRTYYQSLRDLQIDPSLALTRYIAIDYRNVTQAFLMNVVVTCPTPADTFQTGLLLAYTSQYGMGINNYICASNDAVELYSAANQNTFVGGKLSGPIGFNIINSNGNVGVGVSLEQGPAMTFVNRIGSNSIGTFMLGVRTETSSFGPVWLNGKDGSW